MNTLNVNEKRSKVNAAWRAYLKGGSSALSLEVPEQRDLNTGNSVPVPQDYSSEWTEAQKQVGPIATLVNVSHQPTGRPLKHSTFDDTGSTMTFLSEGGATGSVEQYPTMFSTVRGGSDTLVSTVLYSRQEADDAEDIGEFLNRIAFRRGARATEYALLSGKDNGTNTQLPNSPTNGILGNVTSGVTGVATTGPTYAQMAALAASVDVSYRNAPNAGFYVSSATFAYLVAQTDSTGRPLYSFGDDGLLRVAGKPVYVAGSGAMQDYTVSGAPIVLFGDYSRFWKYVDGGGLRLRVLIERYSDIMVNALVIEQRLQAAALVSSAVKSMVTA
ncbi:MAG TPA: phage major capsid protein [Terracidiphilus sp.]|nr:phage major capsid protein [Terracidiphilus sp.]